MQKFPENFGQPLEIVPFSEGSESMEYSGWSISNLIEISPRS